MRLAMWRAGSRRLVNFVRLFAVAALIAAAASPAVVSAHALLRSTTPAAGATLGSVPESVTLTFSETPDIRLTSIKVLDTVGTNRASGSIEAVGDPAATVRMPISLPGDGVYTVSWRTVSSVDGHISAGSFVFGVGQAPPTIPPDDATSGSSQSGSPPAIGGRWLLYLGFMALFGAAWVALAVARGSAPDLLALAAAGWILTAVGSIAVVAVQWAETGAPIEQLPGTSIGLAGLARGASLALVGIALAALAVVPRFAGRRGWGAVLVAAAVTIVVDVGTGHAATGPTWIAQVAAQSMHGIGAAAWVGGLAGLLVMLRTTPAGERLETARRYSSWAGIALVIVAVTGAARAFAEIGTLEALVGTDFGRVVLAKSALLLLLAGLGAFNRFVTLKTVARVGTLLRRVGTGELVLAAAILGLSAMLVNLTPPASAGGPSTPTAQPAIALGHDFGTSVQARLVATPGAAGSNAFDLALTDYDSGAPLDATAVELRFEIESLAEIGTTSLDLAREGVGRFSGSGPNLSIDGIWTATAIVTVPGGAVAVPLVLATKVGEQAVEQLVSPGLPTIYSVSLGAVGTAQVYLDPGSPGQNELHVTFFDAAGSEQPINAATMAMFPAGTAGSVLAERMLEPGHFVATVDVVASPLTIEVITPFPVGRGIGQVHLHVTIEVTP
ncbi:MAG: copper resistance protein CopC [Candidatus Limnocylindrales bacterium]